MVKILPFHGNKITTEPLTRFRYCEIQFYGSIFISHLLYSEMNFRPREIKKSYSGKDSYSSKNFQSFGELEYESVDQ